MVAVANKSVSPQRTVTAPPASNASLPVSMMISCPPIVALNFLTVFNFYLQICEPEGQGLGSEPDSL